MTFITRTIPNLYNGVSQQPVTQRLPTQCEEQVNMISRVSTGVSKRPKTVTGESISGTKGSSKKQKVFRTKNKLGQDIVMLVYANGSIRMKNLETGTDSEIVPANTYLEDTDSKNIKIISKDDRYLFLNKNVEVTKNSGTASSADNTSMIMINQGHYSSYYGVGVTVNGVNAAIGYTTPAVTASGAGAAIVPSAIANEIRQRLITQHSQLNGANCVVHGNTVAILDTDSSTKVYWSKAGVAGSMTAVSSVSSGGSLQDYTRLPANWYTDTTIKIQPNPYDNATSYYVKYDVSSKAWIESVGANAENSLMPQTMPIVVQELLIDFGNGLEPDFSQLTDPWEHRLVGDNDTAPFPSIVGNKIKDMFFWGDRLGFLSGSSLSLSGITKIKDEYGKYEFFPSTTAYLVESDRIDISASTSGKTVKLLYALPQDRQLIIYAKNVQMILTSSQVSQARLVDISEYAISEKTSPILVGYNAYLPLDRGAFAGIMNFTQLETTSFTAEEITQHVPTYIKGSITQLAYCANEDMVFALSDEDSRTVYVQNRFIREQKMFQNSWHKWEFPFDIKSVSVDGSLLNINAFREYESGGETLTDYEFLQMNLASDNKEGNNPQEIDFIPLLDQYLNVDRDYLAAKGWTSGEITYSLLGYDDSFVNGSIVGVDNTGVIYRTDEEILSKLETTDLHIGYIYNSEYVFSKQVPSFYNQQGKIVESFTTLVIRRLNLLFYDTAKFKMRTELVERSKAYEKGFSSMVVGSLGSLLGKLNLRSGTFKFPVNSKHDACKVSVISEHPYPCNFTAAEWSGTLIRRAGRY